MANEEADSRPISVSELLARRQAAGASSTPAPQGRGRRRVGRDGSVSMSELTGEIPKITDDPTPPAGPKPSAAKPSAAKPSAAPKPSVTPTSPVASTSAPTTSTPPPANPQVSAHTQSATSSFPRSESPAARAATPGVTPVPATDPTSLPRFTTASGMPGYPPAPPTLPEPVLADVPAGGPDEGADAVDAVDAATASPAAEQTTVIPTVESTSSPSTASESSSSPGAGFAEVMDDFDSYRSFSDVEDEPAAPAKPKRRIFGRRKKADTPSRATAAKAASGVATEQSVPASPAQETAPEQPTDQDSVWAPTTDRSTIITNEPIAADTADELLDAEPADSEPIAVGYTAEPGGIAEPAAPDEVETALHEIEDSATATPEATSSAAAEPAAQPLDEPSAPALAYSELAEGESYAAAMPLASAGRVTESVDALEPAEDSDDAADSASRRRARAALRDNPTGDENRAVADRPAKTKKDAKSAKGAKKADRALDVDTEHGSKEHSPVKAWALLILEVLAGIAIGIGLFWGFTELWRWSPWFALVLAVLVIFGIVTFAHVVRHARDLLTTLLALGVGLIVTMGPLVLLT